jgi:hypothetical protein
LDIEHDPTDSLARGARKVFDANKYDSTTGRIGRRGHHVLPDGLPNFHESLNVLVATAVPVRL